MCSITLNKYYYREILLTLFVNFIIVQLPNSSNGHEVSSEDEGSKVRALCWSHNTKNILTNIQMYT